MNSFAPVADARPKTSALGDLLAEDYADNLAEGHRRHPTQFAGPFVTAHLSISHPGSFKATFEAYLAKIFRFLFDPAVRAPLHQADQTLNPDDIAKRLARLFSFSNSKIDNELLLYELRDTRFADLHESPSVVWRLEVNREYLSFTLFARLKLESRANALVITALPPVGDPGAFRAEALFGPDFSSRLSEILFRELEQLLESEFEPMLADIRDWSNAITRGKLDFRGPKIFARFSGPVVPWTVFGPALRGDCVPNPDIWCVWRGLPPCSETTLKHHTGLGEGQRTDKCIDGRPFFPGFRERSISSATPDLNWALTCTDLFLSRIWPGLEAHLLNGLNDDSVACYMQHGHAIYISSLGGRRSTSDDSASRYLILYDDPEGVALKGPTTKSTDDRAIDITRRISRLVGRMHDLGVARLWALSGQAMMKGFAQFLRSIEIRIQELNHHNGEGTPSSRLREINKDLYDQLGRYPTPLHYNSTRTAHNLNIIDDLLADLNVVQIPGRQPYDRFVRRRFRSVLVYLTGIADRLQRVTAELDRRMDFEEQGRRSQIARLQMANTQLAAKAAEKVASLQAVADFFVRILAFYYVPLIFYYAMKSLAEFLAYAAEIPKSIDIPSGSILSIFDFHIFAARDIQIQWFEFAPATGFLTALLFLYIALPRMIIRDLVVFSDSPTKGSLLLTLSAIFFPFHFKRGRELGVEKLKEVVAEKAERDRILGASLQNF